MIKFIKLSECDGVEILINIDNISYYCPQSGTIVISGNHGEGNGLLHLNEESNKKLKAELYNNHIVI